MPVQKTNDVKNESKKENQKEEKISSIEKINENKDLLNNDDNIIDNKELRNNSNNIDFNTESKMMTDKLSSITQENTKKLYFTEPALIESNQYANDAKDELTVLLPYQKEVDIKLNQNIKINTESITPTLNNYEDIINKNEFDVLRFKEHSSNSIKNNVTAKEVLETNVNNDKPILKAICNSEDLNKQQIDIKNPIPIEANVIVNRNLINSYPILNETNNNEIEREYLSKPAKVNVDIKPLENETIIKQIDIPKDFIDKDKIESIIPKKNLSKPVEVNVIINEITEKNLNGSNKSINILEKKDPKETSIEPNGTIFKNSEINLVNDDIELKEEQEILVENDKEKNSTDEGHDKIIKKITKKIFPKGIDENTKFKSLHEDETLTFIDCTPSISGYESDIITKNKSVFIINEKEDKPEQESYKYDKKIKQSQNNLNDFDVYELTPKLKKINDEIELSLDRNKYVIGLYRQKCIKETICLFISIGVCFFDVYSDMTLGYKYINEGKYSYGILTYLFVLSPSFISTYFIYKNYYKFEENSIMYKLSKMKWPLALLFVFQIPAVMMIINNFLVIINKKEIYDYESEHFYKTNNTYLLILKILECFFEAAPQLTLQIVIILHNIEESIQDTSLLAILRWVSIGTSFLTIAWVSTLNQKTMFSQTELKFGLFGTIIQYLWNLLLIASRIIIICMFFVCAPIVATCFLIVHCIVISLVCYWRLQYFMNYPSENQEDKIIYSGLIIFSMTSIYFSWLPFVRGLKLLLCFLLFSMFI